MTRNPLRDVVQKVQDTMLDLVQGVQNVVQVGAECGAGRCRRCRMWCKEVQGAENLHQVKHRVWCREVQVRNPPC